MPSEQPRVGGAAKEVACADGITALAACIRTGTGCLSAKAQEQLWRDESQSLMSYGISGIAEFKAPICYKQQHRSSPTRYVRMALRVTSKTSVFRIQSEHEDREVAQRKWLDKALSIKDPPHFLRTAMDKLRPYIDGALS